MCFDVNSIESGDRLHFEDVERLEERDREFDVVRVGDAVKEYVDVNPDTTIGLSCFNAYARIWS